MAARTIPGTHNQKISAQTVANSLSEIGVRPLYLVYMQRFLFALVNVVQISLIKIEEVQIF